MSNGPLSCQSLETKFKELVESLSDEAPLGRRLRRSLSWLERAQSEAYEDDIDAGCIFLWVAFNAAYAVPDRERKEWEQFNGYFRQLVPLDPQRIHDTLREDLLDPILELMKNVYVFRGFWDCLDEQEFDWVNWRNRGRFERELCEVQSRLEHGNQSTSMQSALRTVGAASSADMIDVLVKLFDRLYVLRNQLMHGCATRSGTLNRRQVEQGERVLRFLIPLFLDIMMDNPGEDWGELSYPVRGDIREDRHR